MARSPEMIAAVVQAATQILFSTNTTLQLPDRTYRILCPPSRWCYRRSVCRRLRTQAPYALRRSLHGVTLEVDHRLTRASRICQVARVSRVTKRCYFRRADALERRRPHRTVTPPAYASQVSESWQFLRADCLRPVLLAVTLPWISVTAHLQYKEADAVESIWRATDGGSHVPPFPSPNADFTLLAPSSPSHCCINSTHSSFSRRIDNGLPDADHTRGEHLDGLLHEGRQGPGVPRRQPDRPPRRAAQ
ncbi:hypothetical protein OH77DRAFT_984678 [Trametes cingulata]|nr:hypothetical protein OH77DRAFT_984678 [Trametes cingulata]